jgi:enoyl-CoA hydratase
VPAVHVDLDDRVATVTLDDPDRRNAFTPGLVTDLVAAFDDLESQPGCGAVIVTGAPPAFCAGADLSTLADADEPGLRSIYEGFLRVARSPLPTVAAVNGPAVGAGLNLALAADLIVAGRSARFDSRFLRLGIHPGGGHTWLLGRRAGDPAVRAMVLFSQVLSGDDAARVGLAWSCVADEDLLGAARELASAAAAVPPALSRRAKQTISSVAALDDHDDAVAVELEAQLWSMGETPFRDGLARARGAGRG